MRRMISLSLCVLFLLLTSSASSQIAFRLGSDSSDFGKDITIDPSGNVIVAGYYYGTVDFDPASGGHNLISNGYIDNFIAKYNSGGFFRWAIGFGSSGSDSPNSVKTDSAGNVYVCGYYTGTTDFDPGAGTVLRTNNGGKDAYVVKYDYDGNFLWVNTFGASSDDESFDLRLDNSGNIFITGVFQNTIDVDPSPNTANLTSHGGNDVSLVKYDSDGNYLWGFNVGGTGNDAGMAVIIDAAGDCYVGGHFTGTVDFDQGTGVTEITGSGGTDIFVAKYFSDQSLAWIKPIGGKGTDQISPGSIALDWLENVYLTGGFSGSMIVGDVIDTTIIPDAKLTLTSNGGTDVFLINFTKFGEFRYAFNFGGHRDDKGQKIIVDDFGSTYTVGSFKDTVDFDPGITQHIVYSRGTNGASDIFVSKHSSTMDLLWADTFGPSTSNPNDLSVAYGIVIVDQYNFFITGRFYKTTDFDPTQGALSYISSGASDIFVVKYSGDGLLWGSAGYPIITVVPKILNFGSVIVDSTRKGTFTVYNTGEQDLEISSVISSNPRFPISSWYNTILPDEAQEFTINFTPTDSGHQTGWVVLNHNALNTVDSIYVSGNGVGFVARADLSINPGWNIISLPLIPGSKSRNILFPTATSDAFAYSGATYIVVDSLECGLGYWLKFGSTDTIHLTGQSLVEETVYVTSGWNLIGSVIFPVETSSIIQEPNGNVISGFFEYSATYIEATTLTPGKGYWVKVVNDGKLILIAP